MNRVNAADLIDQIQDAKDFLQEIGQKVFRISSDLASLDEGEKSSIELIAGRHALFEKEQITYKQLDEFYKASSGYIELLRDVNLKVLSIAGRERPGSDN